MLVIAERLVDPDTADAYVGEVSGDLLDVYCNAAMTRWRETSADRREEVDSPGLRGLLEAANHPGVVLLVTDDRSHTRLREIVTGARAGMVQVFPAAPRALEMLNGDPAWVRASSTAMVSRDLRMTPRVAIPSSFRARPVRRIDADPSDGVPLGDVVGCVTQAAPDENPERLARFLRSLTAARLFAAVDGGGNVRATAGYQLVGGHALILLIDTDPAYQRQGLATAMTSTALWDAHQRGATAASLDASDSGGSVYRRLGFERVDSTVRFVR